MRRALKWIFSIAAVIVALPFVAVGVLLVALNTTAGQHEAESLLAGVLGKYISVAGISGSIPGAPRVREIVLRDDQGVWLTIDDIALDWSPLRLLAGTARIDSLSVGHLAVARLPVSAAPAQPAPANSVPFHLPVTVDVRSAHIVRLDLAAQVAGAPAAVTIALSGRLASLTQGDADATIRQIGGTGVYTLSGKIDDREIAAHVDASEPAQGLISELAALPDLGALELHAAVDGPWNAARTDISLAAGPMRASAKGQVDISGASADLDVTANAPAMAPRPDVRWQSVALDAHVHGSLSKPEASGKLVVRDFSGGGASVREMTADVAGNAGQIALRAAIDGLRIPGRTPDLFAAAPVTLDAAARLDTPDRPVTFSLNHPLLSAKGTARTGADLSAQMALVVPDLVPFAAIGGVDIRGATDLAMTANMRNGATSATLDGTIGLTGGMSPLPGLIGPGGKISVAAAMHGNDVTVSRLMVDGAAITLGATGEFTGGRVALDWTLALKNLGVLTPTVAGTLAGTGHVAGRTDALAATAEFSGDIATKNYPRAPIKVSVDAKGLPSAPSGTITANGTLEGAPVDLDVDANRDSSGALAIVIKRATWKDSEATGSLALAPGATLPTGRITLHAGQLGDFSRLAGQTLRGRLDAAAQLGDDVVTLTMTALDAGIPGNGAARTTLTARVANPTTHPNVTAALAIDGLSAGGMTGNARLDVAGPEQAIGIKLNATIDNLNGAPLQASTTANVDVPRTEISIGALSAVWKGETVRLLAPTRISLANGVSVDRMRIGLRTAELDIAGKIRPTLDVTASLRNVPANLATIFAPNVKAAGTLSADAHITGTPGRPAGTIHATATGLRLDTGPGRALPAANITADATLAGNSARVDTRLVAGRNQISVTGTAPLDSGGTLGLRIAGAADLATLNPILTANGESARGQVSVDATIGGTISAPRATGSVTLAGGEVQDFAQNVRIANIQATIDATGDTIRIARFSGSAGKGTISASGTVGLAAPMPVDLRISAQKAAPLSSDQLNATLDANITVRGAVQNQLAVAGAITIDGAEIRVPDNLPAQVAVLNVQRPGTGKQRPAAVTPPASTAPMIALDVKVHAPGQMFVRGRGLDAELQGDLTIAGTSAAPLISGGFKLRRGTFSLAGQSLTFTSGEVSFDGSGKIDPTLNFVATSSNASVTATLAITGYASAPKITLSSTPTLPQDEVLAQLLFHQSASSLSPFQLAEIAVALAQITNAGGASSFDPLNAVRSGLGLDRLSVGGGGNGSSATVEAGRYVAQGVYVGAKQGTSGGGTQATVQIDLTKGLKLETDVGTGGSSTGAASSTTSSNGTSVGLTYQFQY